MNKVSLKWLKANETAQAGELPEEISDGEIYQRALTLEEKHFDATMFLNYGILGVHGSKIEAPLGTNLYKETLPTSGSSKEYLKLLMRAMGVNFSQAYSVSLFDATKRVMIIDERGYHYATYGDPIITPDMAEETAWRCRRFPSHWRAKDRGYYFWDRELQPQADAIMTDLPRQTLCVYSADCVIGLISDPEHHAVGIFHSMWRNLVNVGVNCKQNTRSIVEELVVQMRAVYGSNPSQLEVQLYPCASKETYEVDGKVADRFLAEGYAAAITEHDRLCEGDRSGKFHVDLNRATAMILERCGVDPLNIRTMPFTTDDPEFPSKRNAQKGRASKHPDISSSKVVEIGENATPRRRVANLAELNNQNVLIVMTK